MTGAGAAELLGDRDAENTHIGEPLPQFAIVRLLAVKHRAYRLGRAFFGQKLAGLVAQLLLFVGEIEIHGATLLWEDLRTRKAVIPRREQSERARSPSPPRGVWIPGLRIQVGCCRLGQ